MKHFISFFLLLCALTIASYSQSDRWVYLGEHNNTPQYIDNQTILYNNQLNRYKVYVKLYDSDGSYQLLLEYVFCNERMIQPISFNYFDKYGGFIKSSDTQHEKYDIIPDSNPEDLYNYLCK